VLLLADVIENFRHTIYSEHGLDYLHVNIFPSLVWTCPLKYTKAELELLSDPDIYLMIEINTRGGIAAISHRQAVAYKPSSV